MTPMELTALPAAIKLFTGDIAEVDLDRGRDTIRSKFGAAGFFLTDVIGSSRDPYATVNKASRDYWSTREFAVIRFRNGINKGAF
jgi:hypothetical protein